MHSGETVANLRKQAEDRVREFGMEPGRLRWRWMTEPPPYRDDVEWIREATAAVLDALNQEGVAAWSGDRVSCVVQIIAAYARDK